MDPRSFAAFLRSRRERLKPEHVGLFAGPRRRTPGLRRDEVAGLAAISLEYYTRLEQARAPHPSRDVLRGIGRALKLSGEEQAHLFHLAGEAPGLPAQLPREVPENILNLLQRMPDTAAILLDAAYDVLAWNPLAAALLEDFGLCAPDDRNLVRRFFLQPDRLQAHYGISGDVGFARAAASQLRAAVARYPRDARLRGLVAELLARSPDFTALWASQDVRLADYKKEAMVHPIVGRIELRCDMLVVPERDQAVIFFTADPGSASEQALRALVTPR